MNGAVLLVEDFDDDIFWMRRSWAKEGVVNPLQVVKNGRQAVEYLSGKGPYSDRKAFPLPCLVLLDLKLPYLMGTDVLEWIRGQANLRGLPVLMLSTSALQSDIDEAYQLGANAFMVKPPSGLQLGDLVRPIRDYWLGMNLFPRMGPGESGQTGRVYGADTSPGISPQGS
ncbi:MAG: putative response regulator, CheY [Pedosphaera sp.]|nr:putative response regulator, CheY [Pedosphaera sp.]